MAATGIKVQVKNVSFFFFFTFFKMLFVFINIMILTWDNPRNDQLHLQHIIGNGMRHHHFDYDNFGIMHYFMIKWTHSWERDCGGPESMWCSGGPETIWTTTKNKKVNPKEPLVT